MVLNRTPICAQHAEMRCALQDLLLHLIAKTIRQREGDDQCSHTRTDTEYRGNRSDARQPPLAPRAQIPKGKKDFVWHINQEQEPEIRGRSSVTGATCTCTLLLPAVLTSHGCTLLR